MSEEILTSYSGVTLSNEEVNSLMGNEPNSSVGQDGEQPTSDEVSQVSPDQSETSEVVESKDLEVVSDMDIDGNTYDMDTIKEALEAFNNKNEWQKTNTEKSQAISAERKALDAERKVWLELKENEDMMEYLKDNLSEDHPLFSDNPQVDNAKEDTSQDTVESDRLKELEDKLKELEDQNLQVEADQQVTADLTKLQQTHPELESQELMDEVIKTAIEKGFTGYQGLEDAFVLAYHTSAENSAFKTAVERARSAKAMKSIPETEGVVKGQHTEPIVKAESYKEARQDALKNYNFYE